MRLIEDTVRDWLMRQGVDGSALREYLRWVRTDMKSVLRKVLKP